MRRRISLAPSFVQHRLVALAGLTGAVLGAWNDPGVGRGWWPLRWCWRGRTTPAGRIRLGEWAAPLAVVSLIGVWASVPDTEPALAAGAVLAPPRWRLRWPWPTARLVRRAPLRWGWPSSARCGWAPQDRRGAGHGVSAIGVVVAAPLVDGFRRFTLSRAGWAVVVVAQVLIALLLSW